MTRLLVSVRSAREALAALAGGADLIDVKEPHRGSLGAATPAVWRHVALAVRSLRPLSAALGELRDIRPFDNDALQGYAFAKLGLAGCAALPDWQQRWQAALAMLPRAIAPVAVAYADYHAAGAPPPHLICAVGQQLGCRALLVDTFQKEHGDVFDVLGVDQLVKLFRQARDLDLRIVLAGSLRLDRLRDALGIWPDYVAVRGAVCQTSRAGELSEQLVHRWAESLAVSAEHAISPAPRTSVLPGRP